MLNPARLLPSRHMKYNKRYNRNLGNIFIKSIPEHSTGIVVDKQWLMGQIWDTACLFTGLEPRRVFIYILKNFEIKENPTETKRGP